MKDCLKRFVNSGLFEASLSLLDELGIRYTKGSAQTIDARRLSTDKLSKAADAALDLVSGTWFVAQIDDRTFQQQPDSVTLDSALSDAGQERYNGLFVFAVEVKPDANVTRTVAATLTRVFNRIAKAQPVILFIRQGHELSLSTCERSEYTQQWRSGEKLGKVSILRNINCENAHRGHINLLSRMSGGATNFDELYKNWMTIFDIKLLSKQFYNELFEWYEWVMQLVQQGLVRFPAYPKDGYGNESKDETIIRIITRMLFVWFIKEKGLIPEKLFNKNQIKQLVKEFDPNSLSAHNYYNAILQNLFFATLNCEKDERYFIPESKPNGTNPGYGVNNLYRGDDLLKVDKENFMSIFDSIPYLNGGLFERLDTKGNYFDGFSKEPNRRAIVPDVLFFGKEENNHIGLLSLFEKYVFTVEENTPLEQNVSLDPELLGRVFENLLGAYNPETDTTARKASGSYYTPREIVEYMVNESLVQHIIKHGVAESTVRDLLEYKETDTRDVSIDERTSIMKALYHIKVLDPACGSGAFPMGMLQQMVHILRQIDPDNSAWKDFLKRTAGKQADKAYRETDDQEERQLRLEQIEKAFNLRYANPDYARKLFIIQNCIYGVDIQPIAMQISKLRFFISLICEQNNGNILPLPNLETKFVCANTLIGLEKGEEVLLSEDLETKKEKLIEIRKQHFYARTSKQKRQYKKQDEKLRAELETMIADVEWFGTDQAKQLTSWDPYDQNASSPFFNPEWMFGVNNGFDIVIGNPPYISYYSNTGNSLSEEERRYYVKNYQTVKKENDRINSMNLMTEKGIKLLSNNGHLSFIVNKTQAVLPSYISTRAFILDETQIKYYIPELSPFSAIVDCLIIGVNKTVLKGEYQARMVSSTLTKSEYINVNQFRNNRLLEFILSNDDAITRMESSPNRLGSILQINRGVNIGGCFDEFLSPSQIDQTYRKYLSGTANIKKYMYHWFETDGYMKLDKDLERSLKQLGETIALGDPTRYEKERLIIPESSQTIIAVYCNEKYYTAYGLMIGTLLNSKYSLKFLCGLLNSNAITYYAIKKEILRKGKKATPHVGTKGLMAIPIPLSTPSQQQPIITLVDKILAAKKADPRADTGAWEAEIDFLVYKLYGLSYDEVLVVDPGTGITREEYDNNNNN